MNSKYLALLLLPFLSLLIGATPADNLSNREQPVLTQLVLRDYTITISSGVDGSKQYDVSTQNGQMLDTSLDTVQLQAKYPELYESLQPAVAGRGENEDSLLLMMEVLDF